MLRLYLIILFLTCNFSTAKDLPLYTWKDKSGNVKYSDTPPSDPNIKYSIVSIKSHKPTSTSNANRSKESIDNAMKWMNAEKERRQHIKKSKQEAAEKQKEQAATCKKLQHQLQRALRSQILWKHSEEKGRHALNEKERLAHFEQLRQKIKKACKE